MFRNFILYFSLFQSITVTKMRAKPSTQMKTKLPIKITNSTEFTTLSKTIKERSGHLVDVNEIFPNLEKESRFPRQQSFGRLLIQRHEGFLQVIYRVFLENSSFP